ncbi:uncharacterized protein Z518_04036 [Rhinocladiella mackenziei CBS 650.93]|uniref:DNA-binding protein RAP1 n=1 Tax=Rhinocladiella mackenziei CBS 650.93 TaxID=1442369 RepID=A0A0D2FVD0_9EURO|nr:uncharacterized protein Z518_04036 [Rhinocladiella mackenziei CBS 650.93]KIX06062.1 hypothetical protein Z518_04036 [Rhinocladiella mackenziei CBS 650.93]
MPDHIVYDGVPRTADNGEINQEGNGVDGPNGNDNHGSKLFSGQKLWFAHTVPSRHWLMHNAGLHGATIVKFDVDADIKLVDHAKKHQAPGTHSYRYVELSIRNGKLENLDSHAIGVPTRAARQVGSTVTAAKTGRTKFTDEEDQLLYNWMKPFEDAGGAYKGNEIYKQFERVHPNHPWQSYRDRWLRITRFQKRRITAPPGGEEPQPGDPVSEMSVLSQQRKRRRGADDDGEEQRADAHQELNRLKPPPVTARKVADEASDRAFVDPGALSSTEPNILLRSSSRKGRVNASGQGKEESSVSRKARMETGHSLTKAELQQLFHLVPNLTHTTPDQFDKAWGGFAAAFSSTEHNPEALKRFFESEVVPGYCRRHNQPIEKVAPYLFRNAGTGLSTSLHDSRPIGGSEGATNPVSASNRVMCSNCYTSETDLWRLDKGQRLCNWCAVFLRVKSVLRPLTARLKAKRERSSQSGNPEAKIPPVNVTARQSGSSVKSAATPGSIHPSGVVQASLNVSSEGVNHPPLSSPRSLSSELQVVSPSFQSESPTRSQLPEHNEARKRSAGRDTQPQSTQKSSTSDTRSQTQQGISQESGTIMGELQSAEAQARPEDGPQAKSPKAVTGVPPFEVSTDQKTNSGEASSLPSLPAMLSTQTSSHSRSNSSPLFMQEDEEGGGGDDLEMKEIQGSISDIDSSRNPTSLGLIKEQHGPNPEPNQQSTLDDSESSQRGADFNPGEVNTSGTAETPTEAFETGREAMENWETAREHHQHKDSQLDTQALFNCSQFGNEDMEFDFALPEPDGGWKRVLGSQLPSEDEDEGQDEEPNVTIRADDRSNHVFGSHIQIGVENGTQVAPVPQSLHVPAAEADTNDGDNEGDEDGREMDDWLALQKSLHKHVPHVEPILFKAVESTTFDFALATEVVEIMLEVLKEQGQECRCSSMSASRLESLLPRDMKGVWTKDDDDLLQSHDKRDNHRVIDKHGHNGCSARFEFLREKAEGQ